MLLTLLVEDVNRQRHQRNKKLLVSNLKYFCDNRPLSLARSYEQGQSKDLPKTEQRQSKDRSRNMFFWNCKDVVLSFWYDLWYKGTGTGRRIGRSKTREPWIITEL